jgi:hypothetical protein
MEIISSNMTTIEVVYEALKQLGFKKTPPDWRFAIEERVINMGENDDSLYSKLKLIAKNMLPIDLQKLLNIKFTTTYSTTLQEFMDFASLSAEDVVELLGEESIVFFKRKRGARPNVFAKGLNPAHTLIEISHPELIKAIKYNKVLYHIATIDANQKLEDVLDKDIYEEIFGSLFEEPLFEGVIELKSNSKISYIAYY